MVGGEYEGVGGREKWKVLGLVVVVEVGFGVERRESAVTKLFVHGVVVVCIWVRLRGSVTCGRGGVGSHSSVWLTRC